MTDPDIVVIGAGAAGIAAATALGRAGLRALVLEAGGRVGGRCLTGSAALGAPFDHGASWLHVGERNPLTPRARELGFRLEDQRRHDRHRVTGMHGRVAGPAELRAYEAAEAAFHAAAHARIAAGPPDVPLAAITPRDLPWATTVEAWEAPVISAAEAGSLSLFDWAANALEGANYAVERGVGTLVSRLAEGLPVSLESRVDRVEWGGARVRVSGPFGTVQARACLVTVSTAVLASERIRFDPPLSPARRDAVAGLPLGLANKVALRAAGADRLDLPPFSSVDRMIAPGEPLMVFQAWPFGRDHVMGYVGGAAAEALAREGPTATVDFAFAELRRTFGGRVDQALRREDAVVTDWGGDPLFGGSYSYARPGAHGARAVLAAPEAPGRLHFAGEACHSRFAGTAGGAWLTGEAAARALAASLGGG